MVLARREQHDSALLPWRTTPPRARSTNNKGGSSRECGVMPTVSSGPHTRSGSHEAVLAGNLCADCSRRVRSGHFGIRRPDPSSTDGVPVIDQRTPDIAAKRLVRAVLTMGSTEVGSPWDSMARAGSRTRCFTATSTSRLTGARDCTTARVTPPQRAGNGSECHDSQSNK